MPPRSPAARSPEPRCPAAAVKFRVFTYNPRTQPLPARQGVQGISDIITIPGLVNVDFADVKAIMCNSGTAMLGVGVSTGKNRAEEAALVRALNPKFCAPSGMNPELRMLAARRWGLDTGVAAEQPVARVR